MCPAASPAAPGQRARSDAASMIAAHNSNSGPRIMTLKTEKKTIYPAPKPQIIAAIQPHH